MSYIKRLKLSGFKSFANPTVLTFEKGFNTVVGANGSGKSNVFDALCFVLGRMSSKGLRADKLGNLVFNGGNSMKASKEAEVSIYLSNENREFVDSELEEIKITRVVSSNGQSKYLLNNEKVTRTEIVEVLARANIDPDGYNIILQGDIMRIVNMTPVERRELIEEISNISGYEEKREKALKKLDVVETNLKDADLLLDEKTKYLRELKSEKEQAEKFHQTKDDLRYNSLLLVKAKIIRNRSLKEKKQEELDKNEEKLEEYREKLNEFEEKTKGIDEEISNLEKEIEIKSHEDFISITNKITALESQLTTLKEKKAENKKHKEELEGRISGVKENKVKTKETIKTLESTIKELESEKASYSKQIEELDSSIKKKKGTVSPKGFEELDSLEEELDSLREDKNEKQKIRQDNAVGVEKLNNKIEYCQSELDKQQQNQNEHKEQHDELERKRKELKELVVSISSKATEQSELSSRYSALATEKSSLEEEESRLRIKADASRELLSSNKAVEKVLSFRSQDSTIRGTVNELASVPEKYSLALETISGKSLFNVVVDSDSTAVSYINYLKEHKIGGATFLPLNKVKTKFNLDEGVLNKKGVIDYALNLISFEKEYESIFHLVFGDTLVVERIEDAKAIGIGKYKMVSLDGDVATKTGAMSGGFKSKKKGLGAFKDDSMLKKLEQIQSRLSTVSSSLQEVKGQKEDAESQLYSQRQQKAEIEGDISKLEKVLSIDSNQSKDLSSQIEQLEGDKAVIEGSLKKLDKEINEIDSKIASLQEKKSKLKGENSSQNSVFEELTSLEDKRDKLKEEMMEISSKLEQQSVQLNSVVKPEEKNLDKILQDTTASLERIKQTQSDLGAEEKKLQETLKEYREKEKELSKGYKEIIAKRDKLKEDKKGIEKKYEKEFTRFDSLKEKSAQFRYAISEFDSLISTLEEELETLYAEIKAEFVDVDDSGEQRGLENIEELIARVDERLSGSPIDVKELQNKVNGLKTKLNSFGSINMKAVEIYDKLNEEFSHLLEKREKLNEEKKEILDFVAEMDEKKRERFMETFEQLQKHFVDIYSKLSSKGEAELLLENPKEVFSSGVEIRVRLSKKNYLDIKSLSGGEKTITAISFIFAVQEFNPASFYIFDEVDAALDIMNSEKLGKLISDSSHKAQYIVVSHSEHLVQSARSIYGVTMDKNKTSGVVSLDLESASEYVDEEEA